MWASSPLKGSSIINLDFQEPNFNTNLFGLGVLGRRHVVLMEMTRLWYLFSTVIVHELHHEWYIWNAPPKAALYHECPQTRHRSRCPLMVISESTLRGPLTPQILTVFNQTNWVEGTFKNRILLPFLAVWQWIQGLVDDHIRHMHIKSICMLKSKPI